MPHLKGTLTKLGTRTAHFWFPKKVRFKDRTIPWWPFIIRQRHETKHYYILAKDNGQILKTYRIPILDYIWTRIQRVDYEEYLLTFTEVHRHMMDGDYDNYEDHIPDQYIGKEVEVWTKDNDHKHFKFDKEHYPHTVKEVEE